MLTAGAMWALSPITEMLYLDKDGRGRPCRQRKQTDHEKAKDCSLLQATEMGEAPHSELLSLAGLSGKPQQHGCVARSAPLQK